MGKNKNRNKNKNKNNNSNSTPQKNKEEEKTEEEPQVTESAPEVEEQVQVAQEEVEKDEKDEDSKEETEGKVDEKDEKDEGDSREETEKDEKEDAKEEAGQEEDAEDAKVDEIEEAEDESTFDAMAKAVELKMNAHKVERLLETRPDAQELQEQGVLLEEVGASASTLVANKAHALEKNLVRSAVSRSLSSRPSLGELKERNIYHGSPSRTASSILGVQEHLGKNLVKNNLNYFLEVRPAPEQVESINDGVDPRLNYGDVHLEEEAWRRLHEHRLEHELLTHHPPAASQYDYHHQQHLAHRRHQGIDDDDDDEYDGGEEGSVFDGRPDLLHDRRRFYSIALHAIAFLYDNKMIERGIRGALKDTLFRGDWQVEQIVSDFLHDQDGSKMLNAFLSLAGKHVTVDGSESSSIPRTASL